MATTVRAPRVRPLALFAAASLLAVGCAQAGASPVTAATNAASPSAPAATATSLREASATAAPLVAIDSDGEQDDEEGDTEDYAAAVQALQARPNGSYRNRPYNWNGQGHADTCVRLRSGTAPLRYADGSLTGFTLTNDILVYDPPRMPDGDLGHGGLFRATSGAVTCANGYARLDAREFIPSSHGRLLFHRGGWGFVGGDSATAVHYGHVLASDLDRDVTPVPSRAADRGHNGDQGNGDACTLSDRYYRVQVRSIPDTMWYYNSRGTGIATTYTIYGDPGADQGTASDRARAIHYTLLSWSWINAAGGGVARALVQDNQNFRRCRGVRAIRLASVDHDTAQKNGWVRAVYGGTLVDGRWYYGWIVAAHRFGTEHVVRHLRRVRSNG